MLKISFYTLIIAGILSFAFTAHQPPIPDCSIYGQITDGGSGEKIPYASLSLYHQKEVVTNATSDAEGNYCFKNIKPGTYRLVTSCVGYSAKTLSSIIFKGQKLKVDIKLGNEQAKLDEVEIIGTPANQKKELGKGKSLKYHEEEKSYRRSQCEPLAVQSTHDSYYISEEAHNTENYNKIDDNEFKEARKNPLSTFSIDVDKASYSNVRRFITGGQLPPADAVRVEEMINYFSYNYPQPKNEKPFSITTAYMACPWNSKHNLIHIGIQGVEVKTENMPANNIVFLVDVSGSMMVTNKLPLLKSGLRLLVEQMRPQDKIALVVYAGAAGVVLPSTSGREKEKIIEALDNLQAGGSTAGGAGILLAYKTAKENFLKEGNNRIVLATDGDFNVGVSSDGDLIRLVEKEREDGVFLTVLGFGTGNYKDSKMEQLADKGNGNYAYIDNILEAKKTLVKEMGGTLLTIAKDVKIQIEFNPLKVKAYRLVGYENRLLANEDFNDDKKDAGELGSGHTVTAMYEIIPADSDELVASVDSLKYQKILPVAKHAGNEVMTIKFRYKEPKETTSKLITEIVMDKKSTGSAVTEDARFSACVAGFGMLLRDSKFRGEASYKNIIASARASKGKDEDGYRAEFIRLVEMAELLKNK
ncbi:MAG: von Willebrand factor type A domain-containing protein [Bacteroidota bacterium]